MLGNTSVTLASDFTTDAIVMNAISTGCGAQTLTFSGTSTFSESTQHLVVSLDGTELMDNHNEPATWSTSATTVGVGSHTVSATIYDHRDGDNHEGVMAHAEATFTVSDCSSGGSGSSSEADCCPGHDPATVMKKVIKKSSGSVKGVSSAAALPARLRPLNAIFFKVYGRYPTFQEWSYWAHRLLTDKPAYDALYGAMQWHQLHGRTIGS